MKRIALVTLILSSLATPAFAGPCHVVGNELEDIAPPLVRRSIAAA